MKTTPSFFILKPIPHNSHIKMLTRLNLLQVCILCLLLFSNSVTAQNKAGRLNAIISTKKFCKEIDYEVQSTKKIVIKNVQLNGSHKKYKFLFDTGTNLSYINADLATELNFTAPIKDSVDDGNVKAEVDFGYLDFRIEEVVFNNVLTGIKEEALDIINVDGVIGMNLLKLCAWQIDIVNDKLYFSSKSKYLYDLESYYKQDLEIHDGVPFVMCGFLPYPRSTTFVDLGDNSFLTINDYGNKYNKNLSLKSSGKAIQRAFSIDVDTLKGFELIHFSKFNFGKTSIRKTENLENYLLNPISYLCHEDWVNIVGAGILDYYSIIFDFPKNTFYSKISKQKLDYFKTFGIGIMPRNNKFYVATVWNNSSAQEQGINAGDEVIKINNLDLINDSALPVYEKYAKIEHELANNNNITITLKRQGQDLECHLTKRDIFTYKTTSR